MNSVNRGIMFHRFQYRHLAPSNTLVRPGVADRTTGIEPRASEPLLSSCEPRPARNRGGYVDFAPLRMIRRRLQVMQPIKERAHKSLYLAVAFGPRRPIVHRQNISHADSGDRAIRIASDPSKICTSYQSR